MKKIITFLLIFLVGINVISATELECKYKLTYGDKSDTVIFYLDTEKGLQDKYKVEGTGSTGSFTSGSLVITNGTIFDGKKLYFDSYDTMQKAFINTDGKPLLTCPKELTYFIFGKANNRMFDEDGYYLVNSNYNKNDLNHDSGGTIEQVKTETEEGEKGEKCYCCGNSSNCTYKWTNNPESNCKLTDKIKEVCTGTVKDDDKKETKNCGSPFTFSPYGDKDASGVNEGYKITGQYYTENGEKYVTLILKKDGKEIERENLWLPQKNSYALDTDVFKDKYGFNYSLRIETFDDCDSVKEIVSCDTDQGSDEGFLYIGADCNSQVGNGKPVGGNNKNGVSADDPSITGFGNKKDKCKQVLGETLSSVVKEAIKWIRIFGGIIAIVNATLKLIPAIISKDAEALNKALKTCVIMAIILVFCILFGWMLNLIGKLFKWDVTCIV